MKYEARLSGLKLLTGRSDAENVRILASHLQEQQTSAASKEMIFFSTCRKVFGPVKDVQLPSSPLWVALRETDLIQTLLQVLIKQDLWKSKLLPREEIDWGISEVLICLSTIVLSKPWRLDPEVQHGVKMKLGEVLSAIYLEYGLGSKSDPDDLYNIQYLTIMTIGFVRSQLQSEYLFQSATNAIALTTLGLAVIFDPLSESDAIGNPDKSILHKHARNILTTLSTSPFRECIKDIAHSVANTYGAERITSKCMSYLANPGYMSRSFTGLCLLGAMAAAKSLHPKFINDGKVHLAIIQWFWEAIRGPQEIIPEDNVFPDNNYDWGMLPVDTLFSICVVAQHLSSEHKRKLLHDLVVEGDLILALGRWFFTDQVTDLQVGACKWFIEEITKQYENDRKSIAVYIQPHGDKY
ncbi:hypothetical protein FS837_002794 [Tulasnella sp. UAMH 9824]|nr:hypothetical protein FS837_002794 [Tulasnella sp. UAMH 9824]